MWEKLKEVALVGTDRKKLDPKLLPDVIEQELSSADGAEALLLQASTYGVYYLQAGSVPLEPSVDVDLPIIEETHQEARGEVLKFLSKIEESDYQIRGYLLNEWLNLLISKEWIVSPDLILKTLDLVSVSSKELKQKTTQVLGDKGKWILSFRKDLLPTETTSSTWEEGTNQQRKKLLTDALAKEPEQALKMIESTWNSESITFKKSILVLLSEHYHQLFHTFLEDLLKLEFNWKPKEKKSERECRCLVAGTLLRSGQGELFDSTIAHLAKYFEAKKKSGVLSFISGNQKTFVLPDYKDAFWDEVFLLRTYGIDQQYDIALFANERLWGLSFFLSHIPPKWWSDQFDQSTERFLDCFLENKSYATTIEGKIVSIYQSSLLENTVKSKNEEMASQLIKAAIPEAATQIAGVLSMTAYESFVIDRGFLLDYTLLESSPDGVWSNAFCAKMIEEAFSEIEKGKYYTLQYLPKAVASHLDPNVEKVLEKYHEKAKEISYFTSWEKYFYDPLKSIFSIKKLVDSYPIEE